MGYPKCYEEFNETDKDHHTGVEEDYDESIPSNEQDQPQPDPVKELNSAYIKIQSAAINLTKALTDELGEIKEKRDKLRREVIKAEQRRSRLEGDNDLLSNENNKISKQIEKMEEEKRLLIKKNTLLKDKQKVAKKKLRKQHDEIDKEISRLNSFVRRREEIQKECKSLQNIKDLYEDSVDVATFEQRLSGVVSEVASKAVQENMEIAFKMLSAKTPPLHKKMKGGKKT